MPDGELMNLGPVFPLTSLRASYRHDPTGCRHDNHLHVVKIDYPKDGVLWPDPGYPFCFDCGIQYTPVEKVRLEAYPDRMVTRTWPGGEVIPDA